VEPAPALAAAAAALAVASIGARARSRIRLGPVDARGRRSTFGPFLAAIGRLRILERARLSNRIAGARAVVPSLPPAEEIVGTKVLLGSVGVVLGLLSPIPPIAPILATAGYRATDVRLARLVAGRRRTAERELPMFLDLLAASASAGLTGQLAVRAAVDAIEGPLAEEFRRALRAVDLGGRWRNEMSTVADRLGLPDLRRAVAALGRSDALGASLSDQLGVIAADVREARRATITERARKAPVKMLFPLVFLILPAFLLLTVVPVLLATLRSIH
jgi:tight adherence protein C